MHHWLRMWVKAKNVDNSPRIFSRMEAPHAIADTSCDTTSSDAVCTITHAFMPRAVDNYHVQYCCFDGCKSDIIRITSPHEVSIFQVSGLSYCS